MTRTRPSAALALFVVLVLPVLGAPAPAGAQDTGSADFSRFVALGDSLGAAFTSGGLARGAQEDSVPALVARQATGATIEQPLVSGPGIPPLLQLQSLAPLVIAPLPGLGQPLNLDLPRPYDNLSVPGFDVGEALRDRDRPGDDLASLILRLDATMLEQALALEPTFALVWLGNNDVLSAATSGRVVEGVTLTPVNQFTDDYTTLVGALANAGADLALATIPDVTAIPFVTTIPPVVVDPATGEPVPGPGGEPIPLLGPGGRPLGPNDRVLLTASELLAQGIGIPAALGGTGQGLPDDVVLSAPEVDAIQARVAAFNQVIRETASQVGAAVADVNALLNRGATSGFNFGGITFTSEFVTGGLISLDGVHATPLGYALAANEFIRAINETYGADVPPVDLSPFLFGEDASAIPSIPGAAVSSVLFTERAGRSLLDVLGVAGTAGEGDGGDGPAGAAPGRPGPEERPVIPAARIR